MGICSANQKNKTQTFQYLLLYTSPQISSAPIGLIQDQFYRYQQQLDQISKQLFAVREIRHDNHQFYNIFAFSTLQFITINQQSKQFDYIIEKISSIEWVYQKDEKIIQANQLRDQFVILLQEIIQHPNLLLYYYNNEIYSQKTSFYSLSILFFRNLIYSYSNHQDNKLINLSLQFNLQNKELLQKISDKLNVSIIIYQNEEKIMFGQNSEFTITLSNIKNDLFLGIEIDDYQSQQMPSQKIYDLYDNSSRKRIVHIDFQYFVSKQTLNQLDLILEYSLTNEMSIKIINNINGFRRVRGDGNCFYTTIVFQYLEYVIKSFNEKDFEQFLQNLKNIDFQINYLNIDQFDNQQKQYLKLIFLSYILDIRGSDNKEQLYINYFSDFNNIFYALSIIFIKNLAHHVVRIDQEQMNFFGQEALEQIMIWEYETDNIEVLLNVLPKYLLMELYFYEIDTDQQSVIIRNYGKNQKYSAHLLYSPGHYCIAIPK